MSVESIIQQSDRRIAFRALLGKYDQSADDYDFDVEEDPRPYLDGIEPISRWVCVTKHDQKFFFLPTFDDEWAAMDRAIEYVNDDIFEETPVAVYDLDTGDVYVPEWSKLPWGLHTQKKPKGQR